MACHPERRCPRGSTGRVRGVFVSSRHAGVWQHRRGRAVSSSTRTAGGSIQGGCGPPSVWPCGHVLRAAGSRLGHGRAPRTIAFLDFWPGFDTDEDRWLSRRWFRDNLQGVEILDEPEGASVVLFSIFGREHQRFLADRSSCRGEGRRAPKLVCFIGENRRPPVGKVPLVFSFDHLAGFPATTHLRLPLWVLDREVHTVLRLHEERLRARRVAKPQRAGFCCWVASNSNMYNAAFRLRFVQMLTLRYKQVACGGESLNNVGGPVQDKLGFLRGFKFNVAFENASYPGYCTEKLLHAFAAGCVPIYWGDPHVSRKSAVEPDFNPAALISAHDFDNADELLAHIAAVDQDPALMQQYLDQPILSTTWYQRLRDWPAFQDAFTELLFEGT